MGSRPLQLWPLLLCKAVLQVMAVYRSLSVALPNKVCRGIAAGIETASAAQFRHAG